MPVQVLRIIPTASVVNGTRKMSMTRNKAKVGALGVASILAIVALLTAFPAMAATNGPTAVTATTTTTTQTSTQPALAVGETITFTSTSGHYWTVGGASPSATGQASGTIVLTVTGAFKSGYTLSIGSGTITIGSNSYSIASGSAEAGPHAAHLVGQGTFAAAATGATPGAFLLRAGAHATLDGKSHINLSLDVQVGGAEYEVVLAATAQVS
jgi:hypothetical protein